VAAVVAAAKVGELSDAIRAKCFVVDDTFAALKQFVESGGTLICLDQACGFAIAELELPIRDVARKSLVAARDLPAGTIVGPDDLVILRPGTGLPPGAMPQVLGRKTARAIQADTPLSEDMLL
jgi:sialic acid synthase SpsE